MKNLTRVFLESAPSRFKLGFGITANVMLNAVSNEVRRDKTGLKINKNCYLTFSSVDVEEGNKVLAESTFSYFNIDKPEYAVKNYIHQFNHLSEILQAVIPKESIKEATSKFGKLLQSNGEIFTDIKKAKKADAKLTKRIGVLQKETVDAFVEAITPFVGEEGQLVSLLVVSNPKGKFLDLPREDKGFIATMGGRKLTIDSKYIRWYAEKDKPETSDSTDMGNEDIVDEDSIIADDDQEMDDI